MDSAIYPQQSVDTSDSQQLGNSLDSQQWGNSPDSQQLGNSPPLEGCPEGGVVHKRKASNYFRLPCNPLLIPRARALRRAYNLSEVLFWNEVKKGKFRGYDFDRQKVIGNYIVDFYCSNCQVVIEIDGKSHNAKVDYDAKRDAFLKSCGLVVIHIEVRDVFQRIAGVMEMLVDHPALRAPLQGRGMPNPCNP